MTRRQRTLLLAAVVTLGSPSCGHRGDPRPPVFPAPPAIQPLQVAQRGTSAILRFPPPDRTADVGGEEVEVQSIEVLVYAERYPLLDPQLLVQAVERQRDLMVEDARAAAEEAARAAERQRAREAGETAPPVADEPSTARPARRTPEELLLRRVPPEALERWRASGLPSDAVLTSSRQLADLIDALWTRLGLPQAVIDPSQPPRLPDAGRIASEAEPLLAALAYERPIETPRFLERAAVVYRIPWEESTDYLVGEQMQVAYPFGSLAPGNTRTRYFLAVRSRSDKGEPAAVGTVVSLAPAAVPVAPGAIDAVVDADGVRLSWRPPAGDLLIRVVDPTTLRYNVYRAPAGEPTGAQPVNRAPIEVTAFVDSTMEWGRDYDYEVGAFVPSTADTLRRESERATVRDVPVIDRFAPEPPLELTLSRAGSTVTLRWRASASADVRAYRVYRHEYPAPPIPPRRERAERAQPGQEPPNPMVEASWTLLASAVTTPPYIDRQADPSRRFVYAIEAIDGAGNVSEPAVADEPGAPAAGGAAWR